jgi:phosphoribosylformylglycinamidine synthase
MVGLLDDVSLAVSAAFAPDTRVVLLGQAPEGLGASEYVGDGEFPRFSLDDERRLSQALRVLAAHRLLRSAQDVSDGGLAVALAECALMGGTGATLQLDGSPEVMLFSEDQGRAVVTCQPADLESVLQLAEQHGVAACVAGWTGGAQLNITGVLSVSLDELRQVWEAPE